jgi:hypothetical protein
MILHTTVPEQYMTCAGMNHLQYQVPRQSTQYSEERPSHRFMTQQENCRPKKREAVMIVSGYSLGVSIPLSRSRVSTPGATPHSSLALGQACGDLDCVDYLDENAATIASRRWVVRLVPWSLLKATLPRPQTGLVNLLICRLVGQLPPSRP